MAPGEDDAALFRRFHSGDAQAGVELVNRNFSVVRGFIRSLPKDDADEIAQQTFLDCLEAAARFRSADGIRSFVAAVVRHRLYAYRRRAERQRRAMVAAEEYTRRVCEPPDVVDDLEGAVTAGLARLPNDLRVVLHLSYWDHRSNVQIAQAIGVPIGTVASRLRRAKEKLRACLLEAQSEPDYVDSLESACAQRLGQNSSLEE